VSTHDLEGTELPARHPEAPQPGEEIPPHYRHCVGCGVDHPTGLHIQVRAAEGLSVSGTFTVTADHQGAPGLAHGGVLSMAIDEVLGYLAWLVRKPIVTAHLETDFRVPVAVGDTLHITASIDGQRGRRLLVSAVACLGSPDGLEAVRARATFVVVSMQHFRDHASDETLAEAIEYGEVSWAVSGFDVSP
jgi:acyl-coenzyme A thioesterase PaaI-like protein